jgi:hypothetical protein
MSDIQFGWLTFFISEAVPPISLPYPREFIRVHVRQRVAASRLGTIAPPRRHKKTSHFKANGRSSFERALWACDHAYAISFAWFCKPHREGSYVGRTYDVHEWDLNDVTGPWRNTVDGMGNT